MCPTDDPRRRSSPSAQVPPINGRPVRKDEIELHDRGLYIESWLPERRSRRKPLLFIHGELAGSWLWERYLGYFAGRGWEGHALNLRNHFWSQTADPAELSFDTYTEDVVAALERLGPSTVVVGHGMGGLLALKAAERMPDRRHRPHRPRAAARPAAAGPAARAARDPGGLRPVARSAGRRCPSGCQRDHRDLTLADVLRIQHLLGQKPHEAARPDARCSPGVPVDRRPVVERPAARHRRRPRPDRAR